MKRVTQQEAIRLTKKLSQPEGMYRPSWLRLRKILIALCHYLPSPWPSAVTLSKRTDIPPSTVARLLEKAEGLGLISRVARPRAGWDGYSYRLSYLDLSQFPVSISTEIENEEERSSSSPTVKKNSAELEVWASPAATPAGRTRNRYGSQCFVCSLPVLPGTGLLHRDSLVAHDFCDSGVTNRADLRGYVMTMRSRQQAEREALSDLHSPPAIGEDPEAELPVYTVRPANPAARLANRFEALWHESVLRRYPAWRGEYRCINLGPAIGYIRTAFLDKGYSEDHVEAYICAFYDELLDPHSELAPKPGQTAWQLFTGWWGKVAVPDPAIEIERQARRAKLREEMEEYSQRRLQAWARIIAAQDRGEEPDPDDYAIIGFTPRPQQRSS